ncbi:alpha/beta fold hydrolase [Desulfobulbus alkaliphilus]|uniref:alpha/beta fold hydrolase n=1 Tax=Desulfobulbus alkaliphilus TaxID=869814 RepID=UPI001965FF4D|nr:alpha/beta fold hydrolase [Desulfobulbus alkaliphilus]MBM9537634.1 alpha/beta hydrolase [Desulfobulbus alkaliphilus]
MTSARGDQLGVILLHGLIRTYRSMHRPARRLSRAGYTVVNVGYPSRSYPIEVLARAVLPPAINELEQKGVQSIHFVTHSMGGLLLRAYMTEQPLSSLGRVVMLSPPNQGSELIDYFSRFRWFRFLFGPAACQLTTAATSLPRQLGPLSCPVGIITGVRPVTPLFSRFFTDANDGRVSVTSAQLPGMTDFLTMPLGHSQLMNSDEVLAQTLYFLANGRFKR